MKKGIIMEIRRNYVSVLTADGEFEKGRIASRSVRVGEEVYYRPVTTRVKRNALKIPLVSFLTLTSISTIFVLCFLFARESTYAYVNIEINPSIELELDENMEVQEIIALNADGEHLSAKLNALDEKHLFSILDVIVDSCGDKISIDEKKMLIGVNYTGQADVEILEQVKEYFQMIYHDWQLITIRVPDEIRELALRNNTSMNKAFLNMIRNEDEAMPAGLIVDEEKKNKIYSFYDISNEQEEGFQTLRIHH